MKITIINGQNHRGSTYHVARMLAGKCGGEITEFFLPKDFNHPCIGCAQCFMVNEEKCPHYDELKPITRALDEADLIILASPVYVYHCTGQMKSFLDHYGYQWMIHRPKEEMFTKQAVVVSTAAGAGMKSTNQDMADSLRFWGISRIYKLGFAVQTTKWSGVSEKKLKKIDAATTKLAKKIRAREGKTKMSLKTWILFKILLWVSATFTKNPPDMEYLRQKGWVR